MNKWMKFNEYIASAYSVPELFLVLDLKMMKKNTVFLSAWSL